ncbi:MAG: zinc metalloprotease HtpX [Chloroflexota bacterium]
MREREVFSQNLKNWLHTAILIGGMLLLVAVLGYALGGTTGLTWAVVIGAVLLFFSQRVSPQWVLNMYKAQPIPQQQAPQLHRINELLAQRANLANVPQLYYVPTKMMNAFAVGRRENAAIAVTDGLLRKLTMRELTAVLAHEMSHVQNNDMRVMAFADVMSRVTNFFSTFGKVLLLVNLPLLLMGQATISWFAVALLIFAPTIIGFLQLALSRTREYDADLDAMQLTGDPDGLISALKKLEHYQANMLREMVRPGDGVPVPSVLRTHPHTDDRIRRLAALTGRKLPQKPMPQPETAVLLPSQFQRVTRQPSWHMMGIWH